MRRGPRLTAHFTTISNAVMNDDRLSFRARGVLMWLLSKPTDWRTRSVAIAAQSPREGREAIRTAMRELEEFGYLVRERVRDGETGQFAIVQIIHEVPADTEPSPAPEPRNPGSGNPTAGILGATERTDRARIETNHPPRPTTKPLTSPTHRAPRRTGVVVSKHSNGQLDALAAACRDRGLTASWTALKPEQCQMIEALLETHGAAALADAARAAHRPHNPTLYAQGWIGAWSTLPLPRPATTARPACGACVNGWIEDPDDLYGKKPAVRCACRSTEAVAA
ncbi:replication protein [Rhodococcus sp. SGAir0479]|nr:replication protein [Rhodococcus sp. SGAir0479]